jgi:general secretion pathway protein A
LYESHFGLREKPFSLLPDPRFLYASETHRRALTMLRYGLAEQAGFVVLTGEVGSGKTMLVRHLLHEAGDDVVIGLVTNTHQAFGELMKWILRAFNVGFAGKDIVEQHDLFIDELLGLYGQGKRAVLIVDEAQNLGDDALEQLRMLSNINSETDQLLQLMLVGQPELRETLRRPGLRQLVQRISIDHHLAPLGAAETRDYVWHRLEVAGGPPLLFTAEACAAVHHFSRGLPRLINALADMALVHCFAEDGQQVTFDTVVGVIEERQGAGGLMAFTELPAGLPQAALRREILGEAAGDPPQPRWIATGR